MKRKRREKTDRASITSKMDKCKTKQAAQEAERMARRRRRRKKEEVHKTKPKEKGKRKKMKDERTASKQNDGKEPPRTKVDTEYWRKRKITEKDQRRQRKD